MLLSLFVVWIGLAQKQELGKVTVKELEQKVHPTDTSASAAILFKKARTVYKYSNKDGFSTITEFSIKLKIYKKEGLQWANFEIPYYVGYKNLEDEQVKISKAYTYNLDNGKITKTKVSKESKFTGKVNDQWETKMVTFPNVVEGSIIELEYEFKSQNINELPVFQYQYNIPVDFAQFQTEIPGFYLYQVIKSGYVEVSLKDKIEQESQSYMDEHNISKQFSYQQVKTIYQAVNIPALIEENYVSNINDYYGKIEHELKTIQYPDEPVKQIATSWESVAKSIYEEKNFGAELKKWEYFATDLKRINEKFESKFDKLKQIYEFVKTKMNWNGKYGYYVRDGVEKAYSESTGNVAEINLILTAMLKMGGLEANPVLLSTRENGIALFSNRNRFNYVIASVVLDGKQYLLDATDKFCTINTLPTRDLNDKGRLINRDGSSEEVNLTPTVNSLYSMNLVANLTTDGKISGQIKEQHFDYNALKFRQNYSGISQESYLEKMEIKNSGLEITNYELKNDKLLYEPIVEIYSFVENDAVESIGEKLYFSPMLYFAMEQNPFKQENRAYPVDFAFPLKHKFTFIFTIPDGYVVESLPKSFTIALDDKQTNFIFSTINKEKQISVNVIFEINSSVIQANQYDNLKEFYKLMLDKQKEKIILKKI